MSSNTLKRLFHPLLTLTAAALLLTIPLLKRFSTHTPLLPGTRSYVIIAHLGLSPTLALLFTLILGLTTALLAHQLIARWTTSPRVRLLAIGLFLLSPFYPALFTSATPLALAPPLLLLALRFRSLRIIATLLLALLTPGFALLAFLSLFLLTKERLPALLVAAPLALFTTRFTFTNPFVGFGTVGGLSLFIIALALIELVRDWRPLRVLLYSALLILSFWSEPALLLLGLASIPLAARALHWLLTRRWQLAHAKTLALLLLACSFLFLLLVHEQMIIQQEPLSATVETLRAAPPGVLLAPEQYAPLITTFSDAQPLLTSDTCRHLPERCQDVTTLYQSKRLPQATHILDRYNITSLLITQEMRDNLWRHDEDGLLFLLKHSDAFQLLAKRDGRELWAYSHKTI